MGCALGREHVVAWSKSDVEELRTVSKTRSSAGTVRSFDTKFGEERVRWELSMQNLEQWSSTVHVDLGAAEMEKPDQEAVRAPNFDTAKTLPMTLSDLEQQEHHGVLSKEHRQMCLMCWERLSVISLSPCGHLCLCSECTVQRSVQSAASMIRFKCPIPGCGQRVCAVHKMLTASQESLRIARERYRHRQQVQRRVIQRWNHKSVVLCCQAWAEHVAAGSRACSLFFPVLFIVIFLAVPASEALDKNQTKKSSDGSRGCNDVWCEPRLQRPSTDGASMSQISRSSLCLSLVHFLPSPLPQPPSPSLSQTDICLWRPTDKSCRGGFAKGKTAPRARG